MAELHSLSGSDPILKRMLINGSRLTRASYILAAYKGDAPDEALRGAPLPPELEESIPAPLRHPDYR
jgi:hypothetical protein